MPIIIETEKVMRQGLKCRKVLKAKALPVAKLGVTIYARDEYLLSCPYVVGGELLKGLVIKKNVKEFPFVLIPGKVITETEYQHTLEAIRVAGQRLTDINAKERAKWQGKERVEI